jgi:hypothetical protein
MSPHQQKNKKISNTKQAIVRYTQVRIKRKVQHQTEASNLGTVNNMCFRVEAEVQPHKNK